MNLRTASNTLQQQTWDWLLRYVLLPAGDRLFGQRMMERLRFLDQAQWWSPERLAHERDRALAALVVTAYAQVPFYRELMDNARIRPESIQTSSDLVRLPVVTKQMLRANYPDRVTRQTGFRSYEASTSGSTGANFRIRQDTFTWGWHRASFLLALQWAGWRFGESHLQTGMTFKRGLDKRLKDWLLGCHYVPASDLSNESLDRNLELMAHHHIQHLWGYPGSLYLMARRALDRGWNCRLASIVTWGDNLYPQYRKTIEQAFGVSVHDTYGCAEGMQIAAQCGSGIHYHVHSLDVIVEFLDDDDQPVVAGQPGNVVLTRLHAGPMPFIRYRVGDVATAGGSLRCSCGRGYQTMGGIQGRDTDVIVTPSGRRLIVHFFTGILEHFQEIDSYQVIQEKLEEMILRIKPSVLYESKATDRIRARLREMGAADIDIQIELVPEIPLTPGGKRRFIISRLSPGSQNL